VVPYLMYDPVATLVVHLIVAALWLMSVTLTAL
jgi:hypothetical protein